MTIAVDFAEALAAFSRRFQPGTEREVVEQQFLDYWHRGALDFRRAEDGTLKVLLTSARVRL